jgi:hypothetical protein
MSVKTPYIHKHADGSVEILGEASGLEALGHALILKAKMGRNCQFTMYDGVNPMIKILCPDDFDETP